MYSWRMAKFAPTCDMCLGCLGKTLWWRLFEAQVMGRWFSRWPPFAGIAAIHARPKLLPYKELPAPSNFGGSPNLNLVFPAAACTSFLWPWPGSQQVEWCTSLLFTGSLLSQPGCASAACPWGFQMHNALFLPKKTSTPHGWVSDSVCSSARPSHHGVPRRRCSPEVHTAVQHRIADAVAHVRCPSLVVTVHSTVLAWDQDVFVS